jgi:hypothetical protein
VVLFFDNSVQTISRIWYYLSERQEFLVSGGGWNMTGTIAVIMVFSIPIIAILTTHFQKQNKIKYKMIQGELELEKLKHQNYLIETERMRLELEHMKLDEPQDKIKLG